MNPRNQRGRSIQLRIGVLYISMADQWGNGQCVQSAYCESAFEELYETFIL